MNPCPYCTASFADFKDLKFHVELHHIIDKPSLPSSLSRNVTKAYPKSSRKKRLDELDGEPQ